VQQNKPVYKRWPAIAFMLATLALTIFFYPILVGQSLTYEMWKLRMWFPNWI
jgi:dolichyl-phosphate-mannose--protein O-mannosyl transferase